jgi:hypothetical protein
VLTLSGVLKDILLVIISILIWSTPVTKLQVFGYSIALTGLMWYKLGTDQIKEQYLKVLRGWDGRLGRTKGACE